MTPDLHRQRAAAADVGGERLTLAEHLPRWVRASAAQPPHIEQYRDCAEFLPNVGWRCDPYLLAPSIYACSFLWESTVACLALATLCGSGSRLAVACSPCLPCVDGSFNDWRQGLEMRA